MISSFDSLFFLAFEHYKLRYKSKANDIALLYILMLQASLLMLIGTFLMLFLRQMHVDVLSVSKAMILFFILLMVLMFRNWIYYTGKKRKVLNTKSIKNRAGTKNIWLLWLMPFSCFVLSFILMRQL